MRFGFKEGAATITTLSMLLNACVPKNGNENPVVASGSGTAVPEITPGVDAGSRGIDYMFGLEKGSVKSVEPMCSTDRVFCVYRAIGADGKYVGATGVWKPEINKDAHTITGLIPGGNAKGNEDGSLTLSDTLEVSQVGGFADYLNDLASNSEWSGLNDLLEDARANGWAVETKLSVTADNNYSFAVTYPGQIQFAKVGSLTKLSADELISQPVNGREIAFSGLTSDGGLMFSIEKNESDLRFDALQELIASQGEKFTMMEDGTVMTSNGEVVTGLSFDKASGKCFVGVGDTRVECSPSTVIIDGDSISVVSVDGNQWITLDSGRSWTSTEPVSGGVATVIPGEGVLVNGEPTAIGNGETVTPAVETDGYLDKLDIVFQSEVKEVQFGGADGPKMLVSTAVEKSGGSHGIHEVDNMPPEVFARAMNAIFRPEAGDTPESVAEFEKIWGEIQRGERPCTDLMHPLEVYDANGNGNAQEINFVPACGSSAVPEGMTEIKGIDFVYGAFYITNSDDTHSPNPEMPWFIRSTPSSAGYGVMWDSRNNTLKLMIGVNYLTGKENSRSKIATYTEMIVDWLNSYSRGGRLYSKSVQTWEDLGAQILSEGLIVEP